MYRLWRVGYRLLAARATVATTAWALAIVKAARGPAAAQKALDALANRLVWSGWPHQPRGWVNLDASRYVWRVRRRVEGVQPRASRRPTPAAGRRLRVGIAGEISGLFPTPRSLFEELPEELELAVFDAEFQGSRGAYAEKLAHAYTCVGALDGEKGDAELGRLARAVNVAGLDLLLVVFRGRIAQRLADLVDTPVVVDVCTGSDLLHHDKVAFHIYCQPEADYFVRDDRIFCGTSRARFGDTPAYDGFLYFDRRGIDAGARLPWADREPLIVFHGSLYKAATPAYLDAVFGLLRDDERLSFLLMGRDDGAALSAIQARAKAAGVGGQVHYDGMYEPVRSGAGEVTDPGWARLSGHLSRARLAPDPWPITGSSARVEAYAFGVPTPHLGVRFDRASWGRRQLAVMEHPALRVEAATATTVDGYAAICRRCLEDERFAAEIVAAQDAVLAQVTSSIAYWRQILGFYERRVGNPWGG